MTDMIERVARIVCRAAGDYPDDDEFNFLGGESIGKAWQKYTEHARSIIQAMREPTRAMLLAGCAKAAEEQVRPIPVHIQDALNIYQAMIDSTLRLENR